MNPKKITVNGVTYDSVDAMPPEARRLYDEMLAKLPELTDRDGDGIPDILESGGVDGSQGPIVRKQITVNGQTYDDVAAMPPAVRVAYELAMKAMSTAKVNTNQIQMSFKVTPGFGMSKGITLRSALRSAEQASTNAASSPQPTPGTGPEPIEVGSGGGAIRAVLIAAALAAVGLMLWLMTRAH